MGINNTAMKNWMDRELKSFGYAFRGIGLFFKSETHAKIHLIAAILVIGMGFYFGLQAWEWSLIIFAIGLVLVAEIFNTAVEKLTDKIWAEQNPQAAFIKDIAAGGVLIAAIAAAIIGIIVFVPYIFR
ncbi:MAG: diacylglycerol kinase family protein [Bacteroidales bacterium]|nr:diacylglycerol kinase family protein [Bacteroidales bacterium]